MPDVQDTSLDAYQNVVETGEDATLRRTVAAVLTREPMTTHEIVAELDRSANAIRPRVNELIRMECVERKGKRRNPSGHDAYVNHLTATGWRYARGEVDPDPAPTLAERQANVVEIAREFVRGNATRDVLQLAVEQHDGTKHRMDPEWHGGLADE